MKLRAFVLAFPLLAASCVGFRPDSVEQPAVIPAPSISDAVRSYNEGSIETALTALEGLARRDTADAAARLELISLYQELGEYGRAVELLGELSRLAPREGRTERELFIALCLAGRYGQARAILPLSNESRQTDFYEGLLEYRTGRPERAAELLLKTLDQDGRQAWAWYFLGRLRAAAGRQAEAEAAFASALRADGNATAALFPLAESVLAQGRFEDAWGLLRRAATVFPDHAGAAARRAELRKSHPELERNKLEDSKVRRERAEPPRVRAADMGAAIPAVRVGLAEKLAGLALKTGADFSLRSPGGELLHRGTRGSLLSISSTAGALTVTDAAGAVLLSSREPVALSYRDESASSLVFDFLSEAGSFFAVSEDRAYRGSIELRPHPDGITLVNTLNMEEYLYAVVPSEIPSNWPREALKAQAVAARSYTLASLHGYAARGFDVYGSVQSAAYRGVLGENSKTSEAVDATRGLSLSFAGRPVKAFYSANSGGYSEDSRSVWKLPAPMRAVPDPLEEYRLEFLRPSALDEWLAARPAAFAGRAPFASPAAYRWQHWVSQDELAAGLRRERDIGKIVSVITRGRGISGRVHEVEISGTAGRLRVSGDRIRSRLGGLRSNLFNVRPVFGEGSLPEYFIFSGAGWGHGVGMCQTGAAGMAAAGYGADEILRHYYPLASTEKLY